MHYVLMHAVSRHSQGTWGWGVKKKGRYPMASKNTLQVILAQCQSHTCIKMSTQRSPTSMSRACQYIHKKYNDDRAPALA